MKERIHVSLNNRILMKLDELCELRDFNDRTAALEQLIREEWERRNGPATFTPSPMTVNEQVAEYRVNSPSPAAASPIERSVAGIARKIAGTKHKPKTE